MNYRVCYIFHQEEGRRKKEEGRRKNVQTAGSLAIAILRLIRWTY
ncbi:MAG: hypothetical protein ACRC62_29675 [Microcoleus sp.]